MSGRSTIFSIITVSYNAAGDIERTVRSVMEQDFRDFEYLIIDGASKDGTPKKAAEITGRYDDINVTIISEPDSGIYDAMNKGLDRAVGEYLIFLNAGDAFHDTDTLSVLSRAIESNNLPGIVYGQTDIVDKDGNRLAGRHLTAPPQLTLSSFSKGMLVCHQAFVVLARIASQFNTSYRFSADYDWCIRCLQHSRHNVYVDRTLVDYLAEGTTTANRRASLIERFRIMTCYYGLPLAILRHLQFIPRFIRRRKLEKQIFNNPHNIKQ